MSADAAAYTPAVNDRVVIDPVTFPATAGRTYTVTKVNRVNVVIRREGAAPGERNIRINPGYLSPAPASGTPAAASTAQVTTVEFLPFLPMGTLVTVAGPTWNEPADQVWIVINHKADDKVKLVRHGGDPDGRYYPGVQRRWITALKPGDFVLTLK